MRAIVGAGIISPIAGMAGSYNVVHELREAPDFNGSEARAAAGKDYEELKA